VVRFDILKVGSVFDHRPKLTPMRSTEDPASVVTANDLGVRIRKQYCRHYRPKPEGKLLLWDGYPLELTINRR